MNKFFEKKYDIRTSDFDKFNHIKPSSVLDLFQDAAGRHAEEIGVGYEAMKNRSYFWVLVKTKFEIISQPEMHQKVVVKTWPLPPNKFIYRREYSIENENGEKLIVGSSEWVVVHSERRRFVSVSDLYSFTDGFHTEMNFAEKLEKIEDFDADSLPYTVNPGFSELDANNHVNNTKYANFVLDAINPEETFGINVFQIDYRKEVLQGTQVDIYNKKNDEDILAKGVNENGDIMFACKIKYKKDL